MTTSFFFKMKVIAAIKNRFADVFLLNKWNAFPTEEAFKQRRKWIFDYLDLKAYNLNDLGWCRNVQWQWSGKREWKLHWSITSAIDHFVAAETPVSIKLREKKVRNPSQFMWSFWKGLEFWSLGVGLSTAHTEEKDWVFSLSIAKESSKLGVLLRRDTLLK